MLKALEAPGNVFDPPLILKLSVRRYLSDLNRGDVGGVILTETPYNERKLAVRDRGRNYKINRQVVSTCSQYYIYIRINDGSI